MKNPLKDRIDLTTQLLFPVLSWSSLQAFRDYDKNEWYKKFVLGIKGEINPFMQAGIEIGEKLATDPNYLPEVPRPEIYEHSWEDLVKLDGIKLTGHIDGWSPTFKQLLEYKTSVNRTKWTKESVKKHGQIDFYCLLLWLHDKIKPEEITIYLVDIPVEMSGEFIVKRSQEPVQIIPTKRTMVDILKFASEIKKTYKEMQEFIHSKELNDKKDRV